MEPADYFVLYEFGDDPYVGLPSLDGAVHAEFKSGGSELPMRYPWMRRRSRRLAFPDDVWLHLARDQRINFDIWPAFSALLISEHFLSLLEDSDVANFKIARLHAVNDRGENVADRDMYFARFTPEIDVIDLQNSEFTLETIDGRPLSRKGKPWIDELHTLTLDIDAIDGRNLFVADDMPATLETMVSRALRDKMTKHEITGVGLWPTTDIRRLQLLLDRQPFEIIEPDRITHWPSLRETATRETPDAEDDH